MAAFEKANRNVCESFQACRGIVRKIFRSVIKCLDNVDIVFEGFYRLTRRFLIMGVTIFNSGSAMMSLGELNKNINKTGQVLAKLSSGEKVGNAKDGPSEYEISEKMRAEVRAIEQDGENVQNGQSVVKIAEGAVEDIAENLRALKEMAINAATDTNTDEDRKIIQKTFDSTIKTINDIVYQTKFNGMSLIDGSYDSRVEPDPITVFWGKSDKITDSDGVPFIERESPFNDGSAEDPVPVNVYTINKDGVYEFPSDFSENGIIVIGQNVHNLKFIGTLADATDAAVTVQYDSEEPDPLNITNELNPNIISELSSTTPGAVFNENRSEPMQIQNGTKANQSMALIMADMHIDKLVYPVPTSSDYEHLNALKPETTDEYKEYQNFLMKAKDMTLQDVSLLTRDDARTAIRVIDSALNYVLDQATNLGAYSKRLDYNQSNIETYYTNLQAADSTIRDADMAREMTEYTKYNILQQSSQAMLAQANQSSSQILSLLQG